MKSKIKFYLKKMEIPTGKGEVARYYSDLMHVVFKDAYCWLYFADKKYYKVEIPLSYIQEHIPATPFFRCNRNGLINFSFYSEYKEDTCTVMMEDGTEFKLSARNITNFKKQKASLNRISPLCAYCHECETKHCPDRDQFYLPE